MIKKNTIHGTERIVYHKSLLNPYSYLWLQLDQNYLKEGSDREMIWTALMANYSFNQLNFLVYRASYDGEIKITSVRDNQEKPLSHTINKTMMRVDLIEPIHPGEKTFEFNVDWHYNINDAKAIWARTGYEHFEDDGNKIYEIAQWFPRMAAYTDVHGWHHKQYWTWRTPFYL